MRWLIVGLDFALVLIALACYTQISCASDFVRLGLCFTPDNLSLSDYLLGFALVLWQSRVQLTVPGTGCDSM